MSARCADTPAFSRPDTTMAWGTELELAVETVPPSSKPAGSVSGNVEARWGAYNGRRFEPNDGGASPSSEDAEVCRSCPIRESAKSWAFTGELRW